MTIKQRIGKMVTKISPVTPEILTILRVEFRAYRSRMNYRLNPIKRMTVKKFLSAENISLNIGCGPFGFDGWVNVDLVNLRNVSFTFDSRKHLPFKDGTVDRIRVEHFFEHLDKKSEVTFFLDECRRVMKKGAVLRIAVPDIEKFIMAYAKNDEGLWNGLGYDIHALPKGFDTKVAILNHVFRQDGEHKYAYDFEGLHYVLSKHGFNKITRQNFRESLDDQLKDDLENHSNHSLYVDCVK
ncbi:MAG TPA: methyltransferase domain-containing protein [Mucilaginibacter sp.]